MRGGANSVFAARVRAAAKRPCSFNYPAENRERCRLVEVPIVNVHTHHHFERLKDGAI